MGPNPRTSLTADPRYSEYVIETKEWGLNLLREFNGGLSESTSLALKVSSCIQRISSASTRHLEEVLESEVQSYSVPSSVLSSVCNESRLEFLFLLIKFKQALNPLSQQSQELLHHLHRQTFTPEREKQVFLKTSSCCSPVKQRFPKPSVFRLDDSSSPVICRICECAVDPSQASVHFEHCYKCHILKQEWMSLGAEIESPDSDLSRLLSCESFSSSLSIFLLENYIRGLPRRHRLRCLLKKRVRLMKEGLKSSAIARSTLLDIDSPSSSEGYGLPPLHPPSLDDFEIISPISRGAYGSVFLCRKKLTSDVFALKAIPASDLKIKNEREILCRTLHPSVVSFYYSFKASDTVFFVMSFARGGDFYGLLDSVGAFEEDVAVFYLSELVVAVDYIHQQNVVHCDLKPDNLLISDNGHLQLTDFGLSKFGVENRELSRSALFRFSIEHHEQLRVDHKHGLVGTPHYIAPECLLQSQYGPEADWWAVGIIAYEFVVGEPPFQGENESQVFASIIKGEYSWPEDVDVSDDYKLLVSCLLKGDPKSRLGGSSIRDMKVFDGIDWSHVYESQPPFVPDLSNDCDVSYFDGSRHNGSFSISDIGDFSSASDAPDEWCSTNISALAEANRLSMMNIQQ